MNETQKIQQTIKAKEFTAHDVAKWFLEQDSEMQSWFLNYLLSFMASSCTSTFHGDSQLGYIARTAQQTNCTKLIELAERINPQPE